MVDALIQDARHAARNLRRAPGSSLTMIATLAIAIAATTAVFAVANALLLRPPAGGDPDRLVRVFANRASNPWYADYLELRRRARTVDLAAFDDQRVSITADGEAQAAFAELVSANYFDVVQIPAARGRMLRQADGEPGANAVVILSDRYWRQRFAADPSVIGREVRVNGAAFSIAGVAPASFQGAYGLFAADVWIPITLDPLLRPGTSLTDPRQLRGVQVIGRLRPGMSRAQAQSDLAALAADLAQALPANDPRIRTVSVYEASLLPPDFQTSLTVFLGALIGVAALLLLAACANVANMMLARGAGRWREIAVRQAIGATRWTLVRLQLTEGVLLAAAATVAAMTATSWLTSLLTRVQLPAPVPLALHFSVDWRVLLFSLALTLTATLLCSLMPALKGAREEWLPALRGGAQSASTRSRLRSVFIVTQVACSVLLLVVAGLFVRSLDRVSGLDLGIDTSNVLLVSVDTETRGYSRERALVFYRDLRERARSTPGVRAASLADIVPLTLSAREMTLPPPAAGQPAVRVSFNATTPGLFGTLGIPLLEGRDFNDDDSATARPVVILNEALARRLYGADAALGRRFDVPVRPGSPSGGVPETYEVIGVAGNASYQRIGEPQAFFAYFPIARVFAPAPTLMVKTAGDPAAMVTTMRGVVRQLDPDLPVFGIQTLEASARISLLPAQIAAGVSGLLGAVILSLSALGVYSVIAFTVRQRRREIGVRLALGATAQQIARLFLRQSMRWAMVGLAAGLVLAIGVSRLVAGLLFGIGPLDAPSFLASALVMLGVTALAALGPSLVAARVNPVDALRAE